MSLQAMREKRANLVTKMRGTLDAASNEKRDLTDAEVVAYDADEAEVGKLDVSISRLEKLEGREATLSAVVPAAARGNGPRNAPADPAKREFESLGEFLYSARFNTSDQRLNWVEPDKRGEQRMDDGASGGFAIPIQFRSELLQVAQSPAIVRPTATVIPAGSPPDGEVRMPALDQSAAQNMYGGVTVNWIGEGVSKADTSAKIKEIALNPKEVAASTVITDKLLRNWQASGPLLSGLLSKAIVAAEDVAFLQGDGVSKPLGILNSAATKFINRATANTVVLADILAMDEVLLGNDPSAYWVCTKRVVTQLRQLKNPAGYFIWQDSANASGLPSLYGRTVKITDRLPALGSKGDLLLIAGSNYLIKDGSGPFVAMSEHVLFQSNKTMFKAFWNVDGQPWLNGPIKTENGDLQYAFVGLDVPA